MASFPVPAISGHHQNRVSGTKILQKRIPPAHGNVESLGEHRLPRLEPMVRSLAAELGCVRDKERQKIADDLHDHIGQNLVLAKMKLDSLKGAVGAEQLALVSRIAELIADTIKDTRSLIHELHPEWLYETSLEEALSWLAEQTEARYGLHCTTDVAPVPRRLAKDAQEVLFHAVRELLVNVAKHAEASAATIVCSCEKNSIFVRVVDNGKGFEPAALLSPNPKTGGFGLMIIRARLGLIGGNLYIDSRTGAGTSVMITLPLEVNRK
jgi:two-component system, NarL family, sensor histidine kinase UhpB